MLASVRGVQQVWPNESACQEISNGSRNCSNSGFGIRAVLGGCRYKSLKRFTIALASARFAISDSASNLTFDPVPATTNANGPTCLDCFAQRIIVAYVALLLRGTPANAIDFGGDGILHLAHSDHCAVACAFASLATCASADRRSTGVRRRCPDFATRCCGISG